MRFLLDQDVYSTTLQFLTSRGHDVVRASQIGLSQASDETWLKTADELDRIFVTRDRDFGSLVFVGSQGTGVLYLRVLPSTQLSVHDELGKVLQAYSENELKKAFAVIEPDGHRIRRMTKK